MTTQTQTFSVPTPRRTRRSSAAVAADRRLVGRIRASLDRDPRAVVKALEVLFERQTSDEQVARCTRHDNERGFSQADARTGSWLVQTVVQGGREAGFADKALLRGKALEMGRRIAHKYAQTQLLELARAKAEADAYEAELEAFDALLRAEEEADGRVERADAVSSHGASC